MEVDEDDNDDILSAIQAKFPALFAGASHSHPVVPETVAALVPVRAASPIPVAIPVVQVYSKHIKHFRYVKMVRTMYLFCVFLL